MVCTWPVAMICLPEDAKGVTAAEDVARLQAAIDTAVSVLWSFTGRQYGCCPRIVRPCPRECETQQAWQPGWGWYLDLYYADWRSIACSCGPACKVGGPGVVHLPAPVCSVTAVTIDGAVADPSTYVLEGDRLYAKSGQWPSQNLRVPAGEPGTWTVEYLTGTPPPAGADQMVALLAGEFWNACKGGKCRLPKRVQSISRQGVSMQMVDPNSLFENMQTGISEVDLWVAAVNPHRLSAPSAVSSPDYPGGA